MERHRLKNEPRIPGSPLFTSMPLLKALYHNVWRRHPLKFLLWLEWVLLFIVAVVEIPSISLLAVPRHPGVLWLGLVIFTSIGLYLPQIIHSRLRHRLIYTCLELFVVMLVTWMGGARLFSILLVIVVMRNCLLLDASVRSMVTLLAFSLSSFALGHRLQSYAPQTPIHPDLSRIFMFSMMLLSGLAMLFLQLLVTAILGERQSREQLAIANQQLRQYALQVEALAIEQERNRIAREIHDALGHSLTVFNLHLDAALRLWQSDPQEARSLLVEARQVAAGTLQEVRQSVSTLRADPLAGQTLATTLAGLCEDLRRATGITPVLHLNGLEALEAYPDQPDALQALKIAAYRIIQEALTNICKYAQATNVNIGVDVGENIGTEQSFPAQGQRLLISINDNGQGFDPQHNTTGFGLQGMRERTLALGGDFQLNTRPGQGCEIRVALPISTR
jgi:signal transduction histidine kinase